MKLSQVVSHEGRASTHDRRNGGMRPALLIMVVQALEAMAITGAANNLITYVFNDMHYLLTNSANIVTNFVGTIFLLSILGGFLSYSYLGNFLTIIIFGTVELIGYVVMAGQAHVPQLKPKPCNMMNAKETCEQPKGAQRMMLFVGLYTIALGSGCVKPNIIAFGADQLNAENPTTLSRYFNMAYLSFCVGQLIALTFLVWIQKLHGMAVGFGISACLMLLALLLLMSATPYSKIRRPQEDAFLSIANLEKMKVVMRVVPIFGCTIVLNCILAQLQTFSVQQGSTMNTKLANFHVPPAALQSIPYILLLFAVPFYDKVFTPWMRRVSGTERGISQLGRIGIGLLISTLSVMTAALVENKRKHVALQHGNSLSILWIAPQFLIFGLSELFAAVGLVDFCYSQSVALPGMQSFFVGLSYCSYSLGFFLSSTLVSLVNKVTSRRNQRGWLEQNELDKDRLDLFYWLLSALSLLNLLNYVFWARWFTRNSFHSCPQPSQSSNNNAGRSIC